MTRKQQFLLILPSAPVDPCQFYQDSRRSLALPLLLIMLKRWTDAPKAPRKKKKGNATYALSSLDPASEDDTTVEDVRVWNISTSETTGCVMASRRNLKHYRQVVPCPPEVLLMRKGGVEECADAEDAGVLADSEDREPVKKQRPKRKRVRITKENDSVSKLSISRAL